jgi:hypothetical protein
VNGPRRIDEEAEDCERAASTVHDPKIRDAYLEMAARWRRMAEQQEAIEEVISGHRKGEPK